MKTLWLFQRRDQYRVGATPVAIYTIRTFAIVNFGYGLAVILGGRQRWSLETYAVIASIPGTPFSFAIWLCVASVGVALGSFFALKWKYSAKLKNSSWFVMAIWWLTYAVCLASAVQPSNHVPFSSSEIAVGNALLVAWLSMIDERKPLDDAIAFSGAHRGAVNAEEKARQALEEALRVLDDSARSVPLLPPGTERSERLPGSAVPGESDSDSLR